ncbi:MAG: septum site-determining protein MinC [Alphaproteobacteria bacterium]
MAAINKTAQTSSAQATTSKTGAPTVSATQKTVTRRESPFSLRGSSFTSIVLRLIKPDDQRFFELLEAKINQAPMFYRNAPVVFDMQDIKGEALDSVNFPALTSWLQLRGLVPIGVQGGEPEVMSYASGYGLPVIETLRESDAAHVSTKESSSDEAENSATETNSAPVIVEKLVSRPARLIEEPVRSGQMIYAEGRDLIVLASVSNGAELIADGNVHVYGSLKGRVLAGARGDQTARIYCQSLEAELLSIAGVYKVIEQADPMVWRKSVQVQLSGEDLLVRPFVTGV